MRLHRQDPDHILRQRRDGGCNRHVRPGEEPCPVCRPPADRRGSRYLGAHAPRPGWRVTDRDSPTYMSAMTDRQAGPLEPRLYDGYALYSFAGTVWLDVPGAAQTALEAGRYGDWILSVAQGDSKICYAATLPKMKEPASANRAKVLLYVSAWPKDGVKSEVSFKLGYPIKAG